MQEMLKDVQTIYEEKLKEKKLNTHLNVLLEGVRSKQYQPLMQRVKCGKLYIENCRFFTYGS